MEERKAENERLSYKYDVIYDITDGKILEDICRCGSATCDYAAIFEADGSPTHIDLNKLEEHDFGGVVIEI